VARLVGVEGERPLHEARGRNIGSSSPSGPMKSATMVFIYFKKDCLRNAFKLPVQCNFVIYCYDLSIDCIQKMKTNSHKGS